MKVRYLYSRSDHFVKTRKSLWKRVLSRSAGFLGFHTLGWG
jgi:hypothetical protein